MASNVLTLYVMPSLSWHHILWKQMSCHHMSWCHMSWCHRSWCHRDQQDWVDSFETEIEIFFHWVSILRPRPRLFSCNLNYKSETETFFSESQLWDWDWDFWREHAAFQRSAFGWSTAGNDVVATIFIRFFFFFFSRFLFPFFSVATFSHRRSARIKKLI